MCGLSGFIGNVNKGLDFLESAKSCLVHRGPDGYGRFIGNGFGFGHNRLALIDRSDGGIQPKQAERYILSFNGEIYNWKDLRTELLKINVRTSTDSDSEVLLLALKEWGLESCLQKLRGVFTFLYFDPTLDSIFVVRDQMGTRPIYIFNQNRNQILISSEIKAFKEFRLEIDSNGLHEYLTFQNFISESTLFKNINTIPPGFWLKINIKTLNLELFEWSNFKLIQPTKKEVSLEELSSLFEQAITRNMIADYPIGSFLSSGIDTTLIAKTAHDLGFNIPTFSIGFEQSSNSNFRDEVLDAKRFSKTIGFRHYSRVISHNDMESSFDNLIWAIEEPRMGQSYPNYFAALLASQNAKGVMSGTGADELFGGYPWRYFQSNTGSELATKNLLQLKNDWHRLLPAKRLHKLIGATENEHKVFVDHLLSPYFPSIVNNFEHLNLSDILKFEFKTFLLGLLTIEDKISMHHRLESRVPFLDQDLVRFALSHDPMAFFEMQFGPKESDLIFGKTPLRAAVSLTDDEISARSKQGFSGPDIDWFNNQSRTWLMDILGNPNAKIWNYISYKYFSSQHLNKRLTSNSDRLLFWSLLSLESAIRQFT